MNALIALFHSRAGAIIQWLAGLIVGKLTALIVALGITLPAESYQQLEHSLMGFFAFTVTFAIQYYQARQAKRLQMALGTEPDTWIKDDTIATAAALKAPPPSPPAAPGK